MEAFLIFAKDVGIPIAGALVMGVFIMLVLKQLMDGIISTLGTLTSFAESLENRARVMRMKY